jgi:hypothetical protein
MEPTARDREIIRLAHREVDPAHAAEFAAITRGPVVAALGLAGLGVVAVAYLGCRRVAELFRWHR